MLQANSGSAASVVAETSHAAHGLGQYDKPFSIVPEANDMAWIQTVAENNPRPFRVRPSEVSGVRTEAKIRIDRHQCVSPASAD